MNHDAPGAPEQGDRTPAEAAFFEHPDPTTPEEVARVARDAGDRFFQISLPLMATQRTAMGVLTGDKWLMKTTTSKHTDILGAIESVGWRLEDVGYVFRETGAVSRDKIFSAGQTSSVTGEVWGLSVSSRRPSRGLKSAEESGVGIRRRIGIVDQTNRPT